jgi:RNA polymerase sigma-70 factor (ECF subfamily)
MTHFEQELIQLRPYLLRFANIQLRNSALAEDVVSETVLAAINQQTQFREQSSIKTYLVSILKFKIIDAIRHQQKFDSYEAQYEYQQSPESDALFDNTGHYVERPSPLQTPEQELQSKQFFLMLDICTSDLPELMGRLFMMREWLDLSSDEICVQLNITKSNLHVMLYRARLRLQECLNIRMQNKNA